MVLQVLYQTSKGYIVPQIYHIYIPVDSFEVWLNHDNYNYYYRIAGNIDGEFNLAVWRLAIQTSIIKPSVGSSKYNVSTLNTWLRV